MVEGGALPGWMPAHFLRSGAGWRFGPVLLCSAPALGSNLSGPGDSGSVCRPWPRVRNVLMPAGLGPLKAPSSCVRGKSWVPVEEQMLQPAWSSVREVLTTWKGGSLNYS